jgi:hypothetical protein
VPLGSDARDTVDLGFSPLEVTASAATGALAVTGTAASAPSGAPPDTLALVGEGGGVSPISLTGGPDGDDGGAGYITLPRFSPDGRRLAFSGAAPAGAVAVPTPTPGVTAGATPGATAGAPPAGVGSAGLLDALQAVGRLWRFPGGAAAHAHGALSCPWIVEIDSGAVRRLPAPAFDDLVGLAWLDRPNSPGGGGQRLLLLHAGGYAVVDADTGETQALATPAALAGVAASALAWYE